MKIHSSHCHSKLFGLLKVECSVNHKKHTYVECHRGASGILILMFQQKQVLRGFGLLHWDAVGMRNIHMQSVCRDQGISYLIPSKSKHMHHLSSLVISSGTIQCMNYMYNCIVLLLKSTYYTLRDWRSFWGKLGRKVYFAPNVNI